MNAGISLAIAIRVVRQLRRDPRTIILLLVIPALLEALMYWVFDAHEAVFQRIGVPLLGIFPLVMMFLVSSITMLRERSSGTLERLMTLPVSRLDLLAGYAIAFTAVAALQVLVASAVSFWLLGLESHGSVAAIIALAMLNAVLGVALGLFVSAFARTEFQAVQFMPIFIMPQIIVCGLFTPRGAMAPALDWLSNIFPMSYSYEALSLVAAGNSGELTLFRDILVVIAFAVVALAAGAATLPRRTP
jgi:ABC-2 type transport system permease protein